MYYEAELSFFQELLKNLHLPNYFITYPFELTHDLDLGIQRLLNSTINFSEKLHPLLKKQNSNKIYRIYDIFFCNYLFFKLPDTEIETYFFIGPYLSKPIDNNKLLERLERFSILPEQFSQITKLYQTLPILKNETFLLTAVFTFGKKLWGSMNNFSLETIEQFDFFNVLPSKILFPELNEPLLSTKILEKQYAAENQFLQDVSQGLTHKAEMYINQFTLNTVGERVSEPIRTLKNYTIVLNTLLKKAVEMAEVPLIHIEQLSSNFFQEIEQISSVKGGHLLQKKMIRKYCLLVQNHSMKDYSSLIQQVLTNIDSNLTADLSLKAHATLLNVNASYLSTLFKKETGTTLTKYVNRKRIEHALLLLNSTNMQIQSIAQFCGISDINYFTKVFKKQVGKTPKEYRDSLSSI